MGRLKGSKKYVDASLKKFEKQIELSTVKDYALIASKTTGVLVVGISQANENLDLTP